MLQTENLSMEEAQECIKMLEDHIIKLSHEPKAQRLIRKYGKEVFGREVTVGENCIQVPLPNSNTEWTYAAFDYVKKVCEGERALGHTNVFPVHGEKYSGKYLLIHV